jgi:hypothetical protein
MWSFGKGPGLAFPPKTDGDFGSNKTMFWLNLYDHRIAQLVEFSVQHQSFCSQSTRLKVTIRGTAKGADPRRTFHWRQPFGLRAIFRGREVGWTPFGPLAIRWSESLIGDHSGGARWLM